MHKTFKVAVIVLITYYALHITSSVYAADATALQKLETQQKEIVAKEQKIKELENKIKELRGQRDSTAADAAIIAAQVERLTAEVNRAELELQQTNESMKLTQQEKAVTEKDITSLSERMDQKKQQLRALLRLLYEQEQESFIRIFFDNISLSDVLAQRDTYEELQSRTIQVVNTMKEESKELQAKEEQLESQHQQLQTLEATLSQQQAEINNQKRTQQSFLQKKRDEQIAYEQKISEVEAAKVEIKKQVFTLQGTGVELSLNNAFDMAKFAGKLTGVRPALLLAVLKVESNLGNNVGSGHYPDDMHPQSREAFVRITKKLNLDPLTAPVSRKPRSGKGWGGAMGPAQIMPATWEGIEGRLATLLNKSVPNPYELTDAFVATAIFLADRGATSTSGEYEAVNKYIAGPYWQYHTWYGDRVLAIAAEYAKEGL